MMTDKEKERFMPREEAKMRKWASRQRALCELIDASEVYYQTEKDIEKRTYYLRVKSLLCMLKERADAHAEKWADRMKENKQ
jgi:hypothetical protein